MVNGDLSPFLVPEALVCYVQYKKNPEQLEHTAQGRREGELQSTWRLANCRQEDLGLLCRV